jgi:hypothetical protein
MPLTNGGTVSREAIGYNRWLAETIGLWLQEHLGEQVFVPHTAIDPKLEQVILEEYGLVEGSKMMLTMVSVMIPECHTMVVSGAWGTSPGCLYEISIAQQLGLSVKELDMKEVIQ